ncbi:MAG: hypothetical protein UT37_C0003G0023 [Parcubacteria group bacterium GW2011_GWA2_39_18]|nr:MAG: hypothetical protein UT37_C0003G0023 [Parcubacteria group bacterium GW2011_GWA2_39_18]
MKNLDSKILYWIFLIVLIVGLVNAFWFNVFFNPLLAILFFIALNFSFLPALFFAIFYGIFFDISSSAPFGQHILSFVVLCAIIFIFRKLFVLKNNIAIFLLCLTFSLIFYTTSLYVWGALFGVISKIEWPSLKIVIQKNTLNLLANFILILPVYIIYFFKKGDLN